MNKNLIMKYATNLQFYSLNLVTIIIALTDAITS